jgi:cytochrome c oxidase cbb3-type subunit 3
MLIMMVAALAGFGCNPEPVEVSPSGATPAVKIPVGPIPGPPVQRHAAANPYAHDSVALQEGRRLFVNYNCAGCHGGHAGGGMGPSLRDQDWIYGDSDANVFDSIAEGRAHGMPAWGAKLPEDQIWKLAAYVKSLRSSEEPDPPPPPQPAAK